MTIVKVHLYQFFVEEEDNTFGYTGSLLGFGRIRIRVYRISATLHCTVLLFLQTDFSVIRRIRGVIFRILDMDPSLIALFPDPADCPHT